MRIGWSNAYSNPSTKANWHVKVWCYQADPTDSAKYAPITDCHHTFPTLMNGSTLIDVSSLTYPYFVLVKLIRLYYTQPLIDYTQLLKADVYCYGE